MTHSTVSRLSSAECLKSFSRMAAVQKEVTYLCRQAERGSFASLILPSASLSHGFIPVGRLSLN